MKSNTEHSLVQKCGDANSDALYNTKICHVGAIHTLVWNVGAQSDLYGLTVAELCLLPFAPVCPDFVSGKFLFMVAVLCTQCVHLIFFGFSNLRSCDSATLMFKVIS